MTLFLTVGGSWLSVNQTVTVINVSLHHFQPLCSKDENAIFWFKGYNHIFDLKINSFNSLPESESADKVNEDFCFKPLYNLHDSLSNSLRKKCSNSELFWSVFSHIQTEYGEILRIFPYSVRMRENADQNNSEYGHLRSDFHCKRLL